MCEACKAPGIGTVGRAAGRKAQREHDARVAADAVKAYQSGQARPRLTATEYAQRVLAVVGGIVLLASVNFLLHALLITLASIFTILAATAVVVTARRRRRLRSLIPAPLPAAPPRTVVTGVTVTAIESPPRAGLAASDHANRVRGRLAGIRQEP